MMTKRAQLIDAGFKVADLKSYVGKLTGGRYHLLIAKRCEPIDLGGTVEHQYHLAQLTFDSIEMAQSVAGEHRGRDDVLMVKVVSIKD